ncbi:hypothetical protein DOTSEDRAFT_28239 [Dothistroma septosporum NZE10]|uniref:Uncharacterized protein n=1 Tax=Dothistroma septosporum (strain NZE10 / CBS 128990) TaxID=675120 RepID=N1PGA8_DOTSN|nr:hypothetical protein DOTSEDRAFT_28239 [Dothistroma septosporum NZE10]
MGLRHIAATTVFGLPFGRFSRSPLNPSAAIAPGPGYKTLDLKSAYIGCSINLQNPIITAGQGSVIWAIAQFPDGTLSATQTSSFTPQMLVGNAMQQIKLDEKTFPGIVQLVFVIAFAALPPLLSIFGVDYIDYRAQK